MIICYAIKNNIYVITFQFFSKNRRIRSQTCFNVIFNLKNKLKTSV